MPLERWDSILGDLTRDNPLRVLPHVESFDRFRARCLEVAREALAFRIPLDKGILQFEVMRAEVGEPSVSEQAARRGRDDLACGLEIVLLPELDTEPLPECKVYCRVPFPTMAGTLIRRINGQVTEWAPLAQLLPSPGLHLSEEIADRDSEEGESSPEGRRGCRTAEVRPLYGRPVTIEAWRLRGVDPEWTVVAHVNGRRWELRELLRSLDSGLPEVAHRPPFCDGPLFTLGDIGRTHLNERLGTTGIHARHLAPGDLEAIGGLLTSDKWPGPDDPNSLTRYGLFFLGDYLEMAVRSGAGRVRNFLTRGKPGREALQRLIPYAFQRGFDRSLSRLWRWRAEYLEDTNPLAVLSAVRKVTLGGPGGLSAKALILDRRDVHRSHYGRLCAIETPESDYIGLNLFLAAHARVEGGRILTPLRYPSGSNLVPPGEEEKGWVAAHPGAAGFAEVRRPRGEVVLEDNPTVSLAAPNRAGLVFARRGQDGTGKPGEVYGWRDPDEVVRTDAYPGQFLGASAALIPFIAHDDGARAMMGAKNMKQAVPLLHPEAPWVRTGFEALVADAAGVVIRASAAGRVAAVDGGRRPRILVEGEGGTKEAYRLPEARGGQHGTFLAFRPRVRLGDDVRGGDLLADGPACDGGELALGRNLLVAYMPWEGYNFEDGIVASERLVREDVLTSLHQEEVAVPVWQGEQGAEIEPQGPRGTETGHLDGDGVIVEGAPVGPGTVLVRKGGNEVVATPGLKGTVSRVDTVEMQPGSKGSERSPQRVIQILILSERRLEVGDKLMGRHGNKGVVSLILPEAEMPHLDDGTPVDLILNPHGVISRMNVGQIIETHLGLSAWLRRREGEEVRYTVPPFGRVDEQWLKTELERRGYAEGKARLRDGRTGRRFDARVTVGVQYVLRLNHLATDKIAGRERGPSYHVVTQQAVRGRRLNGGQRFGEMEAWALVAHDTPHLLRELLTLKSDDVVARTGDVGRSLPESFRLLTLLLRGLGIETELWVKGGGKPLRGIRYRQPLDPEAAESVAIRWARPDEILAWSGGPVTETEHPFREESVSVYRCDRCGREVTKEGFEERRKAAEQRMIRRGLKTLRVPCPQPDCRGVLRRHSDSRWVPRVGGLFCPTIFGRSDEGGYRDRFGHIELAEMVVHPWALISMDSPLVRLWKEKVWGKVAPEKGKGKGKNALEALAQILAGSRYVVKPPGSKRYELVPRSAACEMRQAGSWARTGPDAVRELFERLTRRLPKASLLKVLPVVPASLRFLEYTRKDARARADSLQARYERVLYWNSKVRKLREDAEEGKGSEKELESACLRLQKEVAKLLGRSAGDKGSLTFLLSGKQGVLRQYLLGKRVDYSARAVIVPEPRMRVGEVGLPRAIYDELARDVSPEARERGLLVLINRAPSLHRYSVEAAYAFAHDRGDVILLHPLVCGALNADFDGDTLAVHLPLSAEARREAESLLPGQHLLSVANGKLLLHLTQDIASGIFLASRNPRISQVLGALFPGNSFPLTAGLGRKELVRAIEELARRDPHGALAAAETAMHVGLGEATRTGLTFSLWDIQEAEESLRAEAKEQMDQAIRQSRGASAKKAIDAVWELLTRGVKSLADGAEPNPLGVMVASGARGNAQQVGQLGGLRGYMQAPGGGIFPHFVDSHFRGGLRPLEYFLCAHGTRKTMADKKLIPRQAGEMTRWLVEACYPVVIVKGDCGVSSGIRSPVTCLEKKGVCQRCYGPDLSTGKGPREGLAVGVIAGQSVGERGTQLTMQAFHLGGGLGGGPDIREARALFGGKDREAKEADYQREVFLSRARDIYGGDVDTRHFEVVLRRMWTPGKIFSVRQAALDPSRHFLARASFVQAAHVLADTVYGLVDAKQEKRRALGRLQGYRERLMVGRVFRS